MADLSDVEEAIVGLIAGAIYPSGLSGPSALGTVCRIYRGWPIPSGLNSDLASGIVNITVAPGTRESAPPQVYLGDVTETVGSVSLVATASGDTVTITGAASEGAMVGIRVGKSSYVYVASPSDTPATIAANLAGKIADGHPVASSAGTLRFPGAAMIEARVFGPATQTALLRRQFGDVVVSCWCASPNTRDVAAALVDSTFSPNPFIQLGDGTKSHLRYMTTEVHDQSQNALLYRRDLAYQCEYSAIRTSTGPVMIFGEVTSDGRLAIA